MSTTWGVYSLQGKDAEGRHVDAKDRSAIKWFVRWRVNGGTPHKRTFKQKGHAVTFRARLTAAQVMGWPADARGWPIEPGAKNPEPSPSAIETAAPSQSFEDYCNNTWYPTAKVGWQHKNRLGHRRNMELAIQFLRYQAGDHRIGSASGIRIGDSILLAHLVPDDVRRAIALRMTSNGRTAAVNQRRVNRAIGHDAEAIDVRPERASPATVRAFYITLSMVLRSAKASLLIPHDPLAGTARHAPKPTQARMSNRVVPSINEVFDLADAIASLGPTGRDGRPAGERFRSLILAAGTLGPRPGELAGHQIDWLDWDGEHLVARFHRTEASVYDAREGVRGREAHPLKHRQPDEWRPVPALGEVADAIRLHLDRGYGSTTHVWTSVTGRPLDWHNLMDGYWWPACAKVFAGTSKNQLAAMPPRTLRKAAITFWLDSGITPYLAAEWAGHSEDVAQRYYAGRAADTYAREVALLAGRQPGSLINI